jgi:hypothetical protein
VADSPWASVALADPELPARVAVLLPVVAEPHREDLNLQVGFGRIAPSETETPNMLVDLV